MYLYTQSKSKLLSNGSFFLLIALSVLVSCSKVDMSLPKGASQIVPSQNATANTRLSPARQTARAGVWVSEHIRGFYEYLPKGYDNYDTTVYPLLICMHGIGQVGNGTTDLPGLLGYGPAMMINNGTFPTSFAVDGKTYSMIIITPQLNDVGMFPVDIDNMIEYAKTNYRVDTKRIYLAGLSIGGANVWHYAGYSTAFANKIAAMVPICAWTTPEYNYQLTTQEAQRVASANIKIWQTHSYKDPTAMFSWSVDKANMVRNSVPAPVTDPKLTCFNSDSHDAWTKTYDPTYKEGGKNIYQWMLHYAKGVNATPLPLKVPFTQVVTIKGSNNLYFHNKGDGSTALSCNAISYSDWEGFVVNQVSGNKVSLQNRNFYISAVQPSIVCCNATSVTATETFVWIFNSDGSVSFKGNNGKYLSNNNGSVTCLASTIGVNEKFKINQ